MSFSRRHASPRRDRIFSNRRSKHVVCCVKLLLGQDTNKRGSADPCSAHYMIGWAGFLANMISMLDTMDGTPIIVHRPIMP